MIFHRRSIFHFYLLFFNADGYFLSIDIPLFGNRKFPAGYNILSQYLAADRILILGCDLRKLIIAI